MMTAMIVWALGAGSLSAGSPREWPPSLYEPDLDWKPVVPTSLGVTGVSAVACLTHGCPEVYVAQRGGLQPIVVLDSKTGTFIRAFGDNTTGGANASLFDKIHGLRASRHSPVTGANLWATDAKGSKIFGFNAGTGELLTSFGSRGTGTHPELQFGSVADLAFSQNGSEMFVADGDGGINSRVARLTAVASGGKSSCTVKPGVPPAYKATCAVAARNETACDALSMTCRWHTTGSDVEWATTWVTGNNATDNKLDKYGGNFSSPHSVAYDACWDAVFIADRNHQRVVQLQGRHGGEYTPAWDLKCLLGYHYNNISDPSSYGIWAVRTAQTMDKDHTGKLFVGIGSLKSPPEMGFVSVLNLEDWNRPCGGPSAGDMPPCRKNSGQIRTVFEIGRRFPHEIEVASSLDGADPAEYVYVASVDSHDPEVAPGIGALTRYKAV